MDLGLSGKKALVCGASQGMGRAIAAALSSEGADILICSRTAASIKETADAIKSQAAGRVEWTACDLSDASSRQALIDDVGKKLGAVDILVHNTSGPPPTTAEETSTSDWAKGFESLFQSVVHLNHAFIPDMKRNRWGRIINVTSLSVLEPIPNLAISNAIRSGVTSMLKTLSDELAPHNITVNCVAPGSIATGRIEALIQARSNKNNVSYDQYLAEYIKAIPMGRMGTVEEFASVVTFLASEKASYVTGSTICVDGGRRRSTY